jgi:hypothetical protein
LTGGRVHSFTRFVKAEDKCRYISIFYCLDFSLSSTHLWRRGQGEEAILKMPLSLACAERMESGVAAQPFQNLRGDDEQR